MRGQFLNKKLEASAAELILKQAEDIFNKYGQDITRIRFQSYDMQGNLVPESRIAIRAVDAQQRKFYSHQAAMLGDSFNQAADSLKEMIIRAEDDVVENDRIIYAGIQWIVSRAHDPFIVDNSVIHSIIQIVREQPEYMSAI